MPKADKARSDIAGTAVVPLRLTEMLSIKYDTSVVLPGPPGVRASSSPANMMVADVLPAVKLVVTVC